MNAYVAAVITPLVNVAHSLNERVKSGALPAISRVGLWNAILSHVMDRFVEGFSRVKKCTVPGRGLMALDAASAFTAATKAGPVSLSHLPRDKSYVDAYLSAFYLDNDADLLQWIVRNKHQYPLRYTRAILLNGIGASMKKKQVKDAVYAIETMYMNVPPPTQTTGIAALPGIMSGIGSS